MLGCEIDPLTLDETVSAVDRLIQAGEPVQHCAVNASKIVMLHSDDRLREIIAGCRLVNADGQSVVWASRLLGKPLPERVAGIDLFQALLKLAAQKGYSVYFLGARPEIVAEAGRRAVASNPGLRLVGLHHGYLREGDTEDVVAEVNRARPQILFVGMPSPQKEYWLSEHLERLGVPFAMGVGGSFDVVAGAVAPSPRLDAARRTGVGSPLPSGADQDVETLPYRQREIRRASAERAARAVALRATREAR